MSCTAVRRPEVLAEALDHDHAADPSRWCPPRLVGPPASMLGHAGDGPSAAGTRSRGASWRCASTRSSWSRGGARSARWWSTPAPSRSWPSTASGWRWCASGARRRAPSCSRSRPAPASRARRRSSPPSASSPRSAGWPRRAGRRVPSFYTAPGFSTELLTLFLATDLRAVETEAPDDEALERSWLPLAEAVAAIDAGTIRDAKSLVGILWLARRQAVADRCGSSTYRPGS